MSDPVRRTGKICLADTELTVWEETVDEVGMFEVYTGIAQHFVDRGWTVTSDPWIDRVESFAILSHLHRWGRKGDLEVTIETYGRVVRTMFFQNVVHENPHGGRWDFDKAGKMPRFLRMQFFVEAAALLRHLQAQHGYTLDTRGVALPPGIPPVRALQLVQRGPRPQDDPLGHFNARWGAHSFPRGADGWPLPEQCSGNGQPCRNRNGRVLAAGDVQFFYGSDGRARRARVWPAMNGMWIATYGGEATFACHARQFFSRLDPALAHRQPHPRRAERLRVELAKAVEAQNFERAIILRDLLRADADCVVPRKEKENNDA